MRGLWIGAIAGCVAIIGVVLFVRGMDPRPVADAMRAELRAASAPLEALSFDGLGIESGFMALMGAHDTARVAMARVALPYLSDPHIVVFAERLSEGTEAAAALIGSAGAAEAQVALESAHAGMLARLAAGIAHKGVPDEIFVQAMLAVHEGAVEVARGARSSAVGEDVLSVADEVILIQDSARRAMRQWLNNNQHGH